MNKLVVLPEHLLFIVDNDRDMDLLMTSFKEVRKHIPNFPHVVFLRADVEVTDCRTLAEMPQAVAA